jgi:hypothetical protein
MAEKQNGSRKAAVFVCGMFPWARALGPTSRPGRNGTVRKMARLEGFEPPTNGFGSHYSIRLSYRRLDVPRHGLIERSRRTVRGWHSSGKARRRAVADFRAAAAMSSIAASWFHLYSRIPPK